MVKLRLSVYDMVAKVVVTISCPEVTEMAEAFENMFRNVNTAPNLYEAVQWLLKDNCL